MTGELYVYDSRGQALHPPDADADSKMRSFFDERVAAISADRPTIEIYGKVKTEKQREQVSFRFVGERYETLFRDFGTAIDQQLVDGRGWDFPAIQDGPGNLFRKLLSEYPTFESETNLNSYFNFDKEEFNHLEGLTKSDDTQYDHVPHIKSRSYEAIAEVLPHVVKQWADPVSVSRPRYVAPEFSNFHFTVDETQRQKFAIADDTREAIERIKKERIEQQKRQKLESLSATISELQAYDTSVSEIKQKLNNSLNTEYPNLSIYTQQEISDIKSTPAQQPRQPASKSTGTPSWIGLSILFIFGSLAGGLLAASYFTRQPALWWELSTLLKIVSVVVPIVLFCIVAILYLSRQFLFSRFKKVNTSTLVLVAGLLIISGVILFFVNAIILDGGSDGPEFEVSDIEYDSEVGTGESMAVNVTLTNVGESGSDTVRIRLNGASGQEDENQPASGERNLELNESDEDTIEFDLQAPQDEGEFELIVSTTADERVESVTVVPGPDFVVRDPNLNPPSPMSPGEPFTLTVTVENDGGIEDEQTITAVLEDEEKEENVRLAADEDEEIEFDLTAPNRADSYSIEVSSENFRLSEPIEVEEEEA